MHQILEQYWELRKAGKRMGDLDEEYRRIQSKMTGNDKDQKPTSTSRQRGKAPQQPQAQFDPDRLRRALDRDRAAEAARKYTPHIRRGVYEVCGRPVEVSAEWTHRGTASEASA
jgi:hypothetical protein